MRLASPLLFAAATAFLVSLPAATAQGPDGEPGCSEANPCDWILAVDASGFSDVSATEFASGDWLVATIVNHDSASHTVTLASHDLSLTIPPGGDVADGAPFRLGSPGTYSLMDEPSGDAVDITVLAAEEFDDGIPSGDSQGAPGAPLAALAAGLALAAVAVRRRA